MNAFLGTMVGHSVGADARQRGIHHHSGSIIVMVAIFLSIVFILASSIDIGYVFYMKRDLQKTADLAALAGALQLTTTPPAGNPTTCAATDTAVLAAIGNAQANGFATAAPNVMSNSITVTCGRWDPVANAAQAPNYFAAPIAGAKLNAVKVVVVQTVPAFFGLGSRTISGQAIASGGSPYATFSLGTGLLSVCSGVSPLLNPLVNGLLGSNVCLSAATYNGLVGSQVSLLQIINNLGLNVGTLDQVLNTQVTLAQLINATVQALSPAQMANINIAELANLTTGALGGTLLKLGDILNVNATDGIAALSAQINVLDLINVGTLQVANKNNLIDLGANIDLGALGQVGLQLKLIEPPQMGVGGVGATATSAQVRLALNVNALLGLVNLPLFIDVAPGQAQLQSLQCTAPKNATFKITTGVAEVCLANGQTGMGAPFSCPDVSKPANQVAVLPLVSLGINASLTSPDTNATLYPPPPAGVPPDGPSSKLVGSSLGAILGGILQPGTFVFGGLLSLLNPLLITLGAVLNPVLGAVGALLDTTFLSLGLGVGQSTLNLSSISCGDVKLVY